MYLVVHVCSCDNVIRISELISRYKKQDLIFPLLNILLVSEKYIFLRIHGLGSLKCIGIWDFLVQVSELPSIGFEFKSLNCHAPHIGPVR